MPTEMSRPRRGSKLYESLHALADTPPFHSIILHATPRLPQGTDTRPCLLEHRCAAGPTNPAPG
eukprot:5018317-Alexandrium_andersonii.AAC.1